MVSLGTGSTHNKNSYSYEKMWSAGIIEWIDPLLDIAFSDPAIDKEVEQFVKNNGTEYYRLQIELDDIELKLDDTNPAYIDHLIEATRKYLAEESTRKIIQNIVQTLTRPLPEKCEGIPREQPTGPRKK